MEYNKTYIKKGFISGWPFNVSDDENVCVKLFILLFRMVNVVGMIEFELH